MLAPRPGRGVVVRKPRCPLRRGGRTAFMRGSLAEPTSFMPLCSTTPRCVVFQFVICSDAFRFSTPWRLRARRRSRRPTFVSRKWLSPAYAGPLNWRRSTGAARLTGGVRCWNQGQQQLRFAMRPALSFSRPLPVRAHRSSAVCAVLRCYTSWTVSVSTMRCSAMHRISIWRWCPWAASRRWRSFLARPQLYGADAIGGVVALRSRMPALGGEARVRDGRLSGAGPPRI